MSIDGTLCGTDRRRLCFLMYCTSFAFDLWWLHYHWWLHKRPPLWLISNIVFHVNCLLKGGEVSVYHAPLPVYYYFYYILWWPVDFGSTLAHQFTLLTTVQCCTRNKKIDHRLPLYLALTVRLWHCDVRPFLNTSPERSYPVGITLLCSVVLCVCRFLLCHWCLLHKKIFTTPVLLYCQFLSPKFMNRSLS